MAFKAFKFKARLFAAISAVTVMGSLLPNAQAYDEDTHFYATYNMARYAGIRHEVAARIALGAQWMDESYISDPTSMILLPLTGIKKRRLLHFPSSRDLGGMIANTQIRILGFDNMTKVQKTAADLAVKLTGYEGKLEDLALKTETVEDHPFGSEMFTEGLKTGNLMLASGGLHTLEDSFAHAGTPAEEGHVNFWHWPDRPFSSPEKYLRMTKSVFKALVAMRSLMSQDALDCSVKIGGSQPNCQLDAVTLGNNFTKDAGVLSALREDTLKNPEYVKVAVRDFLQRAAKANYINVTNRKIEEILGTLSKDSQLDAYQTVELVVKSLIKRQLVVGGRMIDIKFVLSDMGRIKKDAGPMDIADYVDSFGMDEQSLNNADSDGVTNLVRAMAQQLLRWNVPVPPSDTHRVEIEDDKSPIRAKEMELRIAAQRRLIKQMYGTEIMLVNNNSKDEVGFAKEVWNDAAAESVLPKADGKTYYATFSLKEKHAWNNMIFRYMFPSLGSSDLVTLVNAGAKVTKLSSKIGINLITLTSMHKVLMTALIDVRPILPSFFKDLVNERLAPAPDNFFYRNPRLFEKYRSEGKFKPLLANQDFWKVKELVAEADAQKSR
jgi:hypothetical protein